MNYLMFLFINYNFKSHMQSGLEERLEDAITEGKLNKASELSDTLANREVS